MVLSRTERTGNRKVHAKHACSLDMHPMTKQKKKKKEARWGLNLVMFVYKIVEGQEGL